jgi:hypothetical protein
LPLLCYPIFLADRADDSFESKAKKEYKQARGNSQQKEETAA